MTIENKSSKRKTGESPLGLVATFLSFCILWLMAARRLVELLRRALTGLGLGLGLASFIDAWGAFRLRFWPDYRMRRGKNKQEYSRKIQGIINSPVAIPVPNFP
jgi:hypothetical protein